MRSSFGCREICVFLCLVLACRLPALAQAGAATGSIRGTVHDPTGAAVAKAVVEARNVLTGYERKSITDDQGRFELPLLPVGTYDIQAKAAGFTAYQQRGVLVELARASDLHIRLAVAGEQQFVTIEADATILTTSSASVDGGLNQRSMESMPVTSRNSFNLALLAAGFNGTRDNEFGNPTFAFGGMQRRG